MASSAGVTFAIVIPARYGSTRFPGKALHRIAGKPMLRWVYESARRSAAQQIVVATDDERIAEVARAVGADVALTRSDHASGTDRIAEVVRQRRWPNEFIVVNVQGDEPLMPSALIDQVAQLLAVHASAAIATVAGPLGSLEEYLDPNVVKVVADDAGRALYFSRAPIPWQRDGAPAGLASQTRFGDARRHVGIYAYRAAALLRIAAAPPAALEQAEQLEQLRALALGLEIRVADACASPGPDVNVPADVARVEAAVRHS